MSRPNLTPLTLVSVLACVLGGRSGLTRRATVADLAQRSGHVGQGVQLGLALDVEQEDVVLQAVAHLGVGLADAGEDDLVAACRRPEGAVQLAAAGHVEAGAVLGHQPAEVQVAVGLDAVADQRLDRGEGLLELAAGGAAACAWL